MANTSATGGYLVETETALNVERFFHDVIMNLTGIDKTLVRPRWQPDEPTMPASGTDWVGFGVSDLDAPESGYIEENVAGTSATMKRQERYAVLCSFYGANARTNLRKMRDGLQVGQNREVLFANNFGYIGCSSATHAPELINDVWFDRYDITFEFVREASKAYNIQSITHASVYPIMDGEINTKTITIVSNS